MRRLSFRALAAASILIGVGAANGQEKAPKVGVSLHASVAEIGDGQPFELAVKFDIPDGFHIYWSNPGDSGLAPSVDWELPKGFSAGPLRFPVPSKHETAGLVTNILEGQPVLLTTIQPPADLRVGQKVAIKADVNWLVCKEACFLGEQEVSITLPVAESAKPAPPDKDGLVFKIAERQQPVAADKAKAVSVSAKASKDTIAKGDEFTVTLEVEVKRGYHIQSNKPLSEFFIPCEVFAEHNVGLLPGEANWPEPEIRIDKTLGKVSEYGGKVQVTIPFKVEAPTTSESLTLGGLLKYQACDDNGRCFPPEGVPWSVNVKSTTVREAQASAEPVAPASDAAAAVPPPADEPNRGGSRNKADEVAAAGGFTAWLARLGPVGWIVLAMLGGLILNIMPCVLPVISIKVLSFVQEASESPRHVAQLGATFAAGIVVSFWILAGGILALQQFTGNAQSWGALFQHPEFVVAMAAVVFVFALSLFGVFEVMLSGNASAKLAGVVGREGYTGAFLKGVLATLLATPCTAPFLAPAITIALAGSIADVFIVFTAVGVGMAAPYVFLTLKPAWMRHLPKPGPWMLGFKQFMGFILVGTVVWLLTVVGGLMGVSGVVWTVGFLSFLGMSCWIYGRVQFHWPLSRKLSRYAMAVAVALFGGWFSYGVMYVEPAGANQFVARADQIDACGLDWSDGIPWVPYRQGLAEELASRGYTVYVDYTAIWCLTCQANKKLVLATDKVTSKMKENRVVPMMADFTRYDPDIQEDLNRFSRDAVPLNIIVPANEPDKTIVLPVAITPGMVASRLDEAGPSTACVGVVATASAVK